MSDTDKLPFVLLSTKIGKGIWSKYGIFVLVGNLKSGIFGLKMLVDCGWEAAGRRLSHLQDYMFRK